MKEYIMKIAILKRAHPKRYVSLQQDLKNEFLLGKDHYPETILEVLKLLDNYNNPNPRTAINRAVTAGGFNGVLFLQTRSGMEVKFLRETNNSFYPEIECNK